MKLKKLLAGALICGSMFACGCNDNYCHADAKSDFSAAYLASPTDNRILLSGLNVIGPYFHGDLDGKGQMLSDGTFSWEGKLTWFFTDKASNQTKEENIPLYIEQRNGSMALWAYRGNVWNKFMLPGIPAGLAAGVKSTDSKTLQANLGAVKKVDELTEENGNKKVRVTLDGDKVASLIGSYAGSVSGDQAVFINRLKAAFEKTDITVDWDYNKAKNETVTLNVNLTPVVRAYAKAVLDERAAGKITLNDLDLKYYEAMGYFAETPLYISIIGVANQNPIMAPANLSAARSNSAVFDDIKKDIATTPNK